MKLASWNVNSIKMRLERVLAFLEAEQVDVLCLQELKSTAEKFPLEAFREAGYHSVCVGQKTYNGVAILSKDEPQEPVLAMADGGDDSQARFAAATVSGVRVYSLYVPNGQAVGTDKWEYKLQWLERLRRFVERAHAPDDAVALCGDFNVAPEDRDVYDPPAWAETVLCHPDARSALQSIAERGFVDTLRQHNPSGGQYSWWDYRMLAFPKNLGIRLDLILASQALARRCTAARIVREQRKGPQPSDHAPVMAEFELE